MSTHTWTITLILAAGSLLSAQTAPKATTPIADSLRLEIARTQRDLLLADATMKDAVERYNAARTEADGLQKALALKVAEAGKSCGDRQIFDTASLACVAKAAPAKDR